MSGMLFSSLVVTTLVLVLDTVYRAYTLDLYFVPVVAFAIPTLAQELARLKQRAVSAARKLLILLTSVCILFQGGYTCRYMLGDYSLDTWSGLYLADINLKQCAQEYVDVLTEMDCTYVLIDYWYANTLIELSDGKVKALPVSWKTVDGKPVASLFGWGTSKLGLSPEDLPPELMAITNDASLKDASPDVRLLHTFTYTSGSEVYLYSIPSNWFHLPARDQ